MAPASRCPRRWGQYRLTHPGETPAGGIGVSAAVYENIKNKEGLTATLLGERQLKNVAKPVTLYTIDA